MKTLFRTLAAVGLLVAGAPAAFQGFPVPEAAFQDLDTYIADEIATYPVPPVTKEDKAAVKAWTAAGIKVEKALAKPSLAGFEKAASKVDKSLTKAFPTDPFLASAMDDLLVAMVGGTVDVSLDTVLDLESLPDGNLRTALSETLLEASAGVDEVNDAIDRPSAHVLLGKVVKAVTSTGKKLRAGLLKASLPAGVVAVVDGDDYASTMFNGAMQTDASGKARYLTFTGTFPIAPAGQETINITCNLLPTEDVILAGVYPVTTDGVMRARYQKVDLSGTVESIDGVTGTVTILTIDVKKGAAKGIFHFTGPNLAMEDADVLGGTFVVTGLNVSQE